MKYDPTLPWRNVLGGGFNDHIGPVMFAQVGADEYHFALALEDRHMNSVGVAHGGLMMSVADTGMGTSAFTAAGVMLLGLLLAGLAIMRLIAASGSEPATEPIDSGIFVHDNPDAEMVVDDDVDPTLTDRRITDPTTPLDGT